jgi:hypothetical protein
MRKRLINRRQQRKQRIPRVCSSESLFGVYPPRGGLLNSIFCPGLCFLCYLLFN